MTDDALRKSIASEYSSSSSIVNNIIPTSDVSHMVIGHKEILSWWDRETIDSEGTRFLQWFMKNNRKSVSYMAKEFEMKKKAAEYARTTLAKTGVIDSVKMNSYRFNDDIFRKISVTPQGKNHGLYMLVDWSGSMYEHMAPTIHQLINLVMFCKQVNIPFRVYAFTDNPGRVDDSYLHEANEIKNPKPGDMEYAKNFNMLELFSSKMKARDYQDMIKSLLLFGYVAQGSKYYGDIYLEKSIEIPRLLNLGGTPLNDAICASFQLFDEFKKSHRLDIVNTIVLSDGESQSMKSYMLSDDGEVYRGDTADHYKNIDVYKVTDPVTKKSVRYNQPSERSRHLRKSCTSALLKLFAYRTGTNVIGMRIVSTSHRLYYYLESIMFESSYFEIEETCDTIRKKKFTAVVGDGYDKCFILAGGKNLQVSNTDIKVDEGASKGKIRTAFKRANGVRKESRVMLSQFIDMVA